MVMRADTGCAQICCCDFWGKAVVDLRPLRAAPGSRENASTCADGWAVPAATATSKALGDFENTVRAMMMGTMKDLPHLKTMDIEEQSKFAEYFVLYHDESQTPPISEKDRATTLATVAHLVKLGFDADCTLVPSWHR